MQQVPPRSAIRPSRAAYRVPDSAVVDAAATDLIGTLPELKRHIVVEHAEDDDYLTSLHHSALQAVGDYTRWPMRTGRLTVECQWPWPLPGYRASVSARNRPVIVLPGPVDTGSPPLACEYHGGQLDPGTAIGVTVRRSPRLPHDGWIELPEGFSYDSDDGRLNVRYDQNWSAIYTGAIAWPPELAHTVYRVAASWYLYREGTVQMERPVRSLMEATLGPYIPPEF